MTSIHDILAFLRKESLTETEKGTRFEHLMVAWLKTTPTYANLFEAVWLWNDFPARDQLGGRDTGIDIVAKTHTGDYWAVQCKCYAATTLIDKPVVDTFISTSGRSFTDPSTGKATRFAHRLWISTTTHWGREAENAIQDQNPAVTRVQLADLVGSPVDWDKLWNGVEGKEARTAKKELRKHQREALQAAHEHYATEDRGKLIMACGTGKTFTSLKLVEQELKPQGGERAQGGEKAQGLVLFLVPSIALLGQSLNDWMTDAEEPLKAICVCSDSHASRKVKRNEDELFGTPVDLALPASTDPEAIIRQLEVYQNYRGLVVIFSTYQSIEIVAAAQRALLEKSQGAFGVFDFIVCDEAHRTTGVKISPKDESHFTKVHDNEIIQGKKRLYMTATPRLYAPSAKTKAEQDNLILCSMDDPAIYGEEFYRVNFAYAVREGILTDYKVLVLTISEDQIPAELLEQIKDDELKELNYDDTAKLIGVINALSKKLYGDNGLTWRADPRLMRRALAFTYKIGKTDEPGTSKNIAEVFPRVSQTYNKSLAVDEQGQVVRVATRHVDGSMGASERQEALAWLAEESEDPQECRIITNVRCLSEGVDIPALDAVLFLSARNSQVDVVQSLGRVMRSFRRGEPDEKKYGYVIIPVVIPEGGSPEEALQGNAFATVWSTLNALRAHDDHFNAIVNSVELNVNKSSKITFASLGFGQAGVGQNRLAPDQGVTTGLSSQVITSQLDIRFPNTTQAIYAKLVEKCGERLYWENWAAEVGEIAKKYIARIKRLVCGGNPTLVGEFGLFVRTLQQNINQGITTDQCVEMLAQHLITRPVFEALFSEYKFVTNNSISSSMQRMVELLEREAVDKDLTELGKFYHSVRTNIGQIDNLAGKQTVIKNLYEKFFKLAFPLTVEKLGTVYTPIECVDFILHSVDDVLKKEFDTSLTQEGVHILDPFTGTGTFVTRLLQSGLIRPEDMRRKYLSEIHVNEIILLAYYIADVNIESVFQAVCPQEEYLPFNGICLTDTFQLSESDEGLVINEFFRENSEEVEKQRKTPIRVIIGNPPYSVGQKSANDNAQNQRYPNLEKRIEDTYVVNSVAKNMTSLYDSYIKAFRWATDRIAKDERGGVIAFISNGAWLDGNSQDGFRASLEKEFDKIYVYNLRGNARTQGELRKREGDGIFDLGSRTPIAITILVRYPAARRLPKGEIYYHDIGEYMSREQKLAAIQKAKSYANLAWTPITPNAKNDWINQRGDLFDTLTPLAPQKKFDKQTASVFVANSLGISTNKDAFLYNFSSRELHATAERMVAFYNQERERLAADKGYTLKVDPTQIVWTRAFLKSVNKNEVFAVDEERFSHSLYRPFCKQQLLFQKNLIHETYQQRTFFPTPQHENLLICTSGVGAGKAFSTLILDKVPCHDLLDKTQCFPLYYYTENKGEGASTLFAQAQGAGWERHDGVSDAFLAAVRTRLGNGALTLTKEDVFYYVYGLLHSPSYRERFANELRKELARIPLVASVEEFQAFSQAGRALAALHLHYEAYAPQARKVAGVVVEEREGNSADAYVYYAVEKMRFPSKENRTTIHYNAHVTIEDIPLAAYDYVVNGKSAIEWVMERYMVKIDKNSGIKNDPNLWSREQGQPRYILDLLLSVIHVSLETMKIVKGLPS